MVALAIDKTEGTGTHIRAQCGTSNFRHYHTGYARVPNKLRTCRRGVSIFGRSTTDLCTISRLDEFIETLAPVLRARIAAANYAPVSGSLLETIYKVLV